MVGSSTKQFISLFLSLALFFGAVLVVALFDQPAALSAIEARRNLESLQEELARQKALIRAAESTVQTYQDLGRLGEGFGFVLPHNIEYGELLNNITGVAGISGLKVGNVSFAQTGGISASPQGDLPTKGYGTIAVTVSLEGSYEGLKAFLDQIEKNTRLFDVQDIQVTQQGVGNAALQYQVTINTYYQS